MLNRVAILYGNIYSQSEVHEDADAHYEYDDLCTPERITNFILLGLYLITMIYVIHQFIKKLRAEKSMQESKWLHDKNKMITIFMIIALLARMIYYSDAFSYYILDNNKHLIWLPIYLNISSTAFFCVSQFCILICRLWLKYVDRALDSNINIRLKKILFYSTWANPALAVVMIGLGAAKMVPIILGIQIFISVSVALMVSISGVKFRSSLEKYVTGPILTRVKLNVLVICICYVFRFAYDLIKLASSQWFVNMRKTEVVSHPNRFYYSLFLFSLIMIVEYLPILMFTLNLNFVFSSSVSYTPTKSGYIMIAAGATIGDDGKGDGEMFGSVLKSPSTGGVKMSLLNFDHE
jgi:hypothetical protein